MGRIWKWVGMICLGLLALGVAMLCAGLITGGGFSRIRETTDLLDMTKFVSREKLEVYVQSVFQLLGMPTG